MKREFYSDPFPPKITGLPVTIWVGTKENGGRPRIWVEENGKYHPVHFLACSKYPDVTKWINKNLSALVDYWFGLIDTGELVEQIKAAKES